ncbi:MAG: universal stress protein [Alphaproteobacteria bacterium]|nr:universal stress protein [Alphaproteobacteria bacterium]
MKTILVAVGDGDTAGPVLATAKLAAEKFGGFMECFYPGMGSPMIITGGFGGGMGGGGVVPTELVAGLEREEQQRRDRARAQFNAFMTEHGIPVGGLDGSGGGVAAAWRDDGAMQASEVVGSYGRIFDLICVGRPCKDDAALSLAFVEAALFESGRPVLLAPPKAPASLGGPIVIAWNASTETARCVAFSMPFLAQAERVVVVTVKGGSVTGPEASELARTLKINGIPAEAKDVDAGSRSVGETILAECKSLSAGLLVKGAYTQSRLKQMIFGGATQYILTAAELPVLMAH